MTSSADDSRLPANNACAFFTAFLRLDVSISVACLVVVDCIDESVDGFREEKNLFFREELVNELVVGTGLVAVSVPVEADEPFVAPALTASSSLMLTDEAAAASVVVVGSFWEGKNLFLMKLLIILRFLGRS